MLHLHHGVGGHEDATRSVVCILPRVQTAWDRSNTRTSLSLLPPPPGAATSYQCLSILNFKSPKNLLQLAHASILHAVTASVCWVTASFSFNFMLFSPLLQVLPHLDVLLTHLSNPILLRYAWSPLVWLLVDPTHVPWYRMVQHRRFLPLCWSIRPSHWSQRETLSFTMDLVGGLPSSCCN